MLPRATHRTRLPPRCCCTSPVRLMLDAALGLGLDLEGVVDLRQVPLLELHVERGADDLDDLAGLLAVVETMVLSVVALAHAGCLSATVGITNVFGIRKLRWWARAPVAASRLVLVHRAEQRRRYDRAGVRLAPLDRLRQLRHRRRRVAAGADRLRHRRLAGRHVLREVLLELLPADRVPQHQSTGRIGAAAWEPVDREPHPVGQVAAHLRQVPVAGLLVALRQQVLGVADDLVEAMANVSVAAAVVWLRSTDRSSHRHHPVTVVDSTHPR